MKNLSLSPSPRLLQQQHHFIFHFTYKPKTRHSNLNTTIITNALPSLSSSPHFTSRRRTRRRHTHHRDLAKQNSPTHLPFDSTKLSRRGKRGSATPLSLLEKTQLGLDKFVADGKEAYEDLKGLVRVEKGSGRVVYGGCRDETARFVGGVVVWGVVVVAVWKVVVGLVGGWGRRGRVEVVTRRDRSLGGKEVVVERRGVEAGRERERVERERKAVPVGVEGKRGGERKVKVPGWWPKTMAGVEEEDDGVDREVWQRLGNKLIQAIMDEKLRGKDVSEDDLLNLRRICRKSGVRLSIETENARDSLYRTAAHFVINICCKAQNPYVQVDGEDVHQFIAGLAYGLGLDATRATTIVSATVAARTRLWILQAWALEMQAKHSEASDELKKICLVHHIFPPEPFSAEMEMVARGLQKHLKLEDRERLLQKLIGVCGDKSLNGAAEALGLG